MERSLSVSKKLVTAERSLLPEESINGLRSTRDAVSLYRTIADVPVTKDLLSSVRNAHKKYQERMKAQKREVLLLDKQWKEEALQKEMEVND